MLKCVSLIKEFQLETYSLYAQIKLAEVMCLLEMPVDGLSVIEGMHNGKKL